MRTPIPKNIRKQNRKRTKNANAPSFCAIGALIVARTKKTPATAQDRIARQTIFHIFHISHLLCPFEALVGTVLRTAQCYTQIKEQRSRNPIPLGHNSIYLIICQPPLIIIAGPSASGKSELAVRLAKKFNGEIVSADSRQVYKGMDIGTGKVPGKWQGVKHSVLNKTRPVIGEFVDVKITGAEPWKLFGEIIST